MNTPTHLLVGAAAFGRRGAPNETAAALLGAAAPDLSLYVMVAWERFVRGRTPREIFDEIYFNDPFWRTVFAIDNSAPLYALILAIGLLARRRVIVAFSGAALLHIALDLPLHHDDGRAHFQPFSAWIFESPLSYWDTARGGAIVGAFEAILALTLVVALWRRHQSVGARVPLGLAAIATLSTGAFWTFVFR